MQKKIIYLVFIILLMIFPVVAQEKYSFEEAKRLTPLIEWRDYGPEAFLEAREKNKPIFLLLTAPSWCYWCQVYESEDYLFHPDMIKTVNENFIPIYVDADKRQDLTRQYLEGGWPSTTIFTPSRERLFGYSGVRPVSNMIENLNRAVTYVNSDTSDYKISYNYQKENIIIPTKNQLSSLNNQFITSAVQFFDPLYGGFGTGQKFPQARTLNFILDEYEKTLDPTLLNIVEKTLENQYTKKDELKSNYNLYDPIDGGFHRYGTQRDWTPPHYEKMLYDNARLLKTYGHLQILNPTNIYVNEVVENTHKFIKDNWYDEINGGFYSNSDVHGEDTYYGEFPRSKIKPRVEKTKYTDWNSEAVLTYLYLYDKTNNPEYKEMAQKSLNYLENEMISEFGAYHYDDRDKKGVRGNLIDNSYMLLALVEGHRVLGEDSYLINAKKIADYSLENLYDWNSGGFFERNSPDKEIYAPGEEILLSKPSEENAIMIYALSKLYSITLDPIYLDSAIKTYGNQINRIGNLDRGYYYVQSSNYILEYNLLDEFTKNSEKIESIIEEKRNSFWLNDLLLLNEAIINNGFDEIKPDFLIDSPFLILLLVSLIAGFLSFASPCTLPILPAFVAYTLKSSNKNIKGMTFSFFVGLILIFVLLGASASLIGSFLKTNLELFSQIAGIGILFFGFYILLGKGFTTFVVKRKNPTSYISSFFFGMALGIAWTPCVGPILVAILLIASTVESVFMGGILLLFYAIGLSVPLILAAFYLSKRKKEGKIWKFIKGKQINFEISKDKKWSIHSNTLISGIIFIILGYLIFSGKLVILNQAFGVSSFQKWIFSIEERILNFFS